MKEIYSIIVLFDTHWPNLLIPRIVLIFPWISTLNNNISYLNTNSMKKHHIHHNEFIKPESIYNSSQSFNKITPNLYVNGGKEVCLLF
jgi:hypothetical protein